jgi:hypothetical protein
VVTVLTPRRSEFPRSVKEGRGAGGGRVRLDDVPPTPKIKPEHLALDLEKGVVGDKNHNNSQDKQGGKKKKLANFSRK